MYQAISEGIVVIVLILGSLLATCLLLLALHHVAWKLFRELFGWPKLLKILKEHRRNSEGEKP
jgi:hypothetical protein